MTTNLPADFTVLIDLTAVADGATSTSRMGGYHSLEDAQTAIDINEADCRRHNINTHKRVYRTFHAVWTEVTKPVAEPDVQRWVLRFRERDDSDGGYADHRTELTENRCAEIAKMNGSITADQVQAALLDGRRIYTSFSYFVLES